MGKGTQIKHFNITNLRNCFREVNMNLVFFWFVENISLKLNIVT